MGSGVRLALRKVIRAATDPVSTFYHLLGRINPESLFVRYAALSRRAGLDKLYFVLSFDCDTDEDIRVAWDVHSRLLDMGVMPTYAVPGDFLRKGEGVYTRIAETGAEFINHGDIEHTYFNEKRGSYASCFFYDEQSPERVRQDIVDGDRTLKEVLGVSARGYRTPHFGTFQRPDQLRFLHGVLMDLGYAFSTSTAPEYGLRHGPVFDIFGIKELPLSGTASRPLQTLDTWSFFEAPDRVRTPEDYRVEAKSLADIMTKGGAGIINVYADPSHIHDQEIFFVAVRLWSLVALPAHYRDVLELI